MLLKHTLYVITGANRGFGKAIAETIAANIKDTRTTIVLVGRNHDQLSSVNCQNKMVSCHRIANAKLTGAIEAQVSVMDELDTLLKVT
jgi:sepiapterin reductase